MTERELVFDAVESTMKQLKGSYSIISLISQACTALGKPFHYRAFLCCSRWPYQQVS